MRTRRALQSLVFAIALVPLGCDSPADVSGPPPCVPADVAGVWDVRWAEECWFDQTQVWTIYQNGCEVTVGSESSYPPSGTIGDAREGQLRLEWWSEHACYTIRETISATVDGDTMTGTYGHTRARRVYPTTCAPGGSCIVAFSGVRR